MNLYLLIKVIHILSASVLFGTGLGIAFFMFRSRFAGNNHAKLYAADTTVLADYCFTLPAVIIQPLSGAALIHLSGLSWTDLWLVKTYVIYIVAGACWIPVVWLQIQIKNLVAHSMRTGEPLPQRYNRLFKTWFLLGWPAFIGLIYVFYLMVAKPTY